MKKPMILVVDDDKVVADSIADIIKDTKKYEVNTVYSAKEALKQLAQGQRFFGLGGNRIKLIFLDIKMPEMDGLQLLEQIRKDYGYDIGVMMLTAFEDEGKWDAATSGFVAGYICKPFDEKELLDTIEKFFAGKEAKQVIKTMEKYLEKKEAWEKEQNS